MNEPTNYEAVANDALFGSWFSGGTEYRKRDGYIEARNNLNPDWIIVDKNESFNFLPNNPAQEGESLT